MQRIDLNADLGEGFGVYALGDDDALLACVTSANIACGFHAGDPTTMARTVAAAFGLGVALGAHPGLPDLTGFGRREMALAPAEIRNLVAYQIGALAAFAARSRRRLQHVKPHGALYAMAEREQAVADAITQAVRDFDWGLILVGQSGGRLVGAGQAMGLRVAHEVFADRAYLPDGALMPRSQAGAVLHDPGTIAARAVRLAREGVVLAADGARLMLVADTLCLHGDTPGAAALARAVRDALESEGVTVRSLGEL
jgi:UPF0271 protein